MKKTNIFREIFSGANGKLSAKRALGGISLFVALGCTTYLTIADGSNEVVENLLITILIISSSLLGLPAITGIWNKSKLSVNEEAPKNTKEDVDEDHMDHNIEIKKGTE